MSSILEALEKAGEERDHGKTPGTPRRGRKTPERRLSVRYVVVLVAGLLLINLLIWWFYIRSAGDPSAQVTGSPAKAPAKTQHASVSAGEAAPSANQPPLLSLREQLRRNTMPSAKPLSEEAQVTPKPRTPAPPSREPPAPVPAERTVPGPAGELSGTIAPPAPVPAERAVPGPAGELSGTIAPPAPSQPISAAREADSPAVAVRAPLQPAVAAQPETAHGGSESSPPEEAVPTVWELPQTVREKVLRLKSSVHVYNELAEQRFVIINMHRYSEGDILPPDSYRLRRIDRDGMVIDYGDGLVRLPRR